MALPGVGHVPAKGEDEQDAAHVFSVAAKRATQWLVIRVGEDGGLDRSGPELHRYNNLSAPPFTAGDQRCLFVQCWPINAD